MMDNLKSHFKMNSVNLLSISQDYQKKFILDLKQRKSDELKILLDNETWNHSQVSPYFQTIVNKINSIELFEQNFENL